MKITGLNIDGTIEFEDYTATEEDLQPVLITKEELEKNGFVCVEVCDDGPGTPKQYRNRFEKWQARTQFQTVDIFYDRITHRYSLNFYGNHIESMKYIHELQRAFAECHIEMEVVI